MIVLDTHVLIWMDADDAALGPQARACIEQAWRAGEVAVSAISFWECAMLADKGRIVLPYDNPDELRELLARLGCAAQDQP